MTTDHSQNNSFPTFVLITNRVRGWHPWGWTALLCCTLAWGIPLLIFRFTEIRGEGVFYTLLFRSAAVFMGLHLLSIVFGVVGLVIGRQRVASAAALILSGLSFLAAVVFMMTP